MTEDKRKKTKSDEPSLITLVHGQPRTRRQFLTSGLISSMAYVSTPTLLSMLASQQARGATDCPSGSDDGIPFLAIELAGGANIPGANVMVGGKGGQADALASSGYRTLGLVQGADQVDASMGLLFHNGSQLLAGINRTTTPEIRANVEGVLFCHTAIDDISTSRLNPTFAIQLAGARGSLADIIGRSAADAGGRMPTPESFYNPAVRPTRITKPEDAVGLVDLGLIAQQLGTDAIRRILKATEQMSTTQIQKFSQLDLPDQVKVLAACGYIKPQENVQRFTAEAVNAATDSQITNHFNLADADQSSLGTMVKLLKDGYAGTATYLIGGNDYHDSTRSTGNARDLRNGELIGRALSSFAEKGKACVIYVFTDGGVASNNGTDWTSDSGSRSSSFMLVYNPTGKVSLRQPDRRQIGQFNDTGAVDTSGSLINASDDNVVMAVTANYLALRGREGELRQVLGKDPFGRNGLEEVLAFNAL